MIIWTAKKGLLKTCLLDPQNQLTAYIYCKGGRYSISDGTGKELLTFSHTSPLSLTIAECLTGTILLRLEEEKSFCLPPRAKEAEIALGTEHYLVQQGKNRSFRFFRDGAELGWIDDILAFCVKIQLETALPTLVVAMLYVVAQRMLHEDDIDIV